MTESQRNRLKNVILYILKNFSGGTDYIKLYKILYFANKKQLAEIGFPIIYDNFKAWHYGPVPSFTGATLKSIENGDTPSHDMESFFKSLKVRKNKLVVGLEAPDCDIIPEYSRGILDGLVAKYKYRSSKEMSKESHDSAWLEAYYRNGKILEGNHTIRPHFVAADAKAPDYLIDKVKILFSKNAEAHYNISSGDDVLAALEKAVLEIHDLLQLEDGWDGEGTYAIKEKAAQNCRNIIDLKRAHIEFVSDIYPTPAGNLSIDWNINGNIVSAEIGSRLMAFYCEALDKNDSYDSPTMEVGTETSNALYDRIEYFCRKD